VIESRITEAQVLRWNTSKEKLRKWQKSFPAAHDDKQATGKACIMDPLQWKLKT
jgi:hypothetical protein